LTALFVSACDAASSGTGDTDKSPGDSETDTTLIQDCDATVSNIDGPLFDQTNNRFTVTVWDLGDEGDEGSFSGSLFDGPPLSFHQEAERIGNCRLLTYDGDACTPSCDNSQYCIDGNCQTPPSLKTIGPIRLRTSNGIDETVTPITDQYFRYFDSEDAADLDWVSVESAESGGLSLKACVPDPIVPISDFSEAFALRNDSEDVTLKWTPPAVPSRIYLRMTTCIGTHGGISPVEIECEGKDTGELTLPGSFLDAFACEGCWGRGECGGHILERFHIVEADLDGENKVQLRGEKELGFTYYPGRSFF
jgi:hypothetical protein